MINWNEEFYEERKHFGYNNFIIKLILEPKHDIWNYFKKLILSCYYFINFILNNILSTYAAVRINMLEYIET
jgi:hypothetical protein